MINKKCKIIMLAALGMLSFNMFKENDNKVVNAEENLTESASYTDMIVRTAINSGEMYTSAKLVDYGIVHGKVSTGNISKFATYSSDATSWTASLGSSSDNAYTSHWKINTLKDDGVIAKITAKDNIEVNITRTQRGGWEDPCVLGIYKENTLGIQTLKEFTISTSTELSEFCGTFDLLKGETLYYEVRMPWDGSHRNMENLPSFTFTQKEVVPVAQTASAIWSKILENVSDANGDYYNAAIVDYTVKHGKVKNNNINDFATISANKFEATDGAIAENWKNTSKNNDGIILAIKANKYVTLEYGVSHFNDGTLTDTLQGWVDDAYLNVYKMTQKGLETIKETKLSASTTTSEISGNVVLETNEIFYYEFIFEWDSRNMQNILPTFKATEIMHNMTHVYAKESSCKEEGNIEYYYCDECEKYFNDAKGENEIAANTIKTTKKNHTEVIDEAVPATCNSTGLTEGKHCSTCNEVIVKQEVVAKLNHTEVIDEAVPATCSSTGLTEGKHCSTCNEVIVKQEVVAKLNHTEVIDEAVPATCSSTGLTEGKHCSTCNEVIVKQEVVAKLDHTFGEWIVTKQPTTTEKGEEERSCSECGTVEKRDIDCIESPSDSSSITPSEEPSITPSEDTSTTTSDLPSTSEDKATDNDTNKKGCKGSATGGIISLIVLAGAILLKRKK